MQDLFSGTQSVFDTAPIGLCGLDLDYRYVTVNARFAQLYGKRPEEFVGRTVEEVLPDWAEQILGNLRAAREANGPVESEITITRRKEAVSETAVYLRTSQPVRDSSGAVVGMSVALIDITARKQAERALRESEENLRYTVELTPHIPWTADPNGMLTSLSLRWIETTGMRSDPETLKRWILGVHPEDRERTQASWTRSVVQGLSFDCEYRVRCRQGEWRWHRARAYPRRNAVGEILKWYGTMEDIHDRKQAETALADKTRRLERAREALDRLAHLDHLTELANRRTFDGELMREIERARRARLPLAMVLFDVDHFKRFNDRFGHPAGDEVLRRVSRALDSVIRRPADIAARIGGEEFALLLPNTSCEGAQMIAARASEEVRSIPVEEIANGCNGVSVSGGVAMLEITLDKSGDQLARELLARADEALYQAKAQGRNRVVATQSLQAACA